MFNTFYKQKTNLNASSLTSYDYDQDGYQNIFDNSPVWRWSGYRIGNFTDVSSEIGELEYVDESLFSEFIVFYLHLEIISLFILGDLDNFKVTIPGASKWIQLSWSETLIMAISGNWRCERKAPFDLVTIHVLQL